MKIVLVEDDARLAGNLVEALKTEGFAVRACATAGEALIAIDASDCDFVLLDINLPDRNGWWLIERLRHKGITVPILCLTARDTVADRVRGLDAGADDYMVKPFALEELTARIRALLRRRDGRAEPVITVADLVIDPAAGRAWRAGRPLELRPKEFALLSLLAHRPGRVFSRATIASRIWDSDFGFESNVVDVHVGRLRRVIDDAFPTKLIHSVRAVGYVLEPRTEGV